MLLGRGQGEKDNEWPTGCLYCIIAGSTGGSELAMELINMKINATMSPDQRQLMVPGVWSGVWGGRTGGNRCR